MKNAIITTLAGAAGVAALFAVLVNAAAMPDVYFSYSTDQCVKVVNYDDSNYTCENYPSKFNHVWVK